MNLLIFIVGLVLVLLGVLGLFKVIVVGGLFVAILLIVVGVLAAAWSRGAFTRRGV